MKKGCILIAITTTLLCSCSTKTGQQGEIVANDSVSAVTGSATTEPVDKGSLAEEVQQRVAAMYDDIINHYIIDSLDNWNSHELYFSDSLKWLYSQLPDDDIIIDFDPWTWAQDYDTLFYKKVEVAMLTQDTAQATVTLSLWKGDDHPIILELIRERHGDDSTLPKWYVNDFRSGENPTWSSVADEIRDYIKNYKQKSSNIHQTKS